MKYYDNLQVIKTFVNLIFTFLYAKWKSAERFFNYEVTPLTLFFIFTLHFNTYITEILNFLFFQIDQNFLKLLIKIYQISAFIVLCKLFLLKKGWEQMSPIFMSLYIELDYYFLYRLKSKYVSNLWEICWQHFQNWSK